MLNFWVEMLKTSSTFFVVVSAGMVSAARMAKKKMGGFFPLKSSRFRFLTESFEARDLTVQ